MGTKPSGVKPIIIVACRSDSPRIADLLSYRFNTSSIISHTLLQQPARALKLSRRFLAEEIITTEMVLVEVLAGLSGRGQAQRLTAARHVQQLITESAVEVIPQTSEQFRAALERYADRPDQSWSLTDCASFLVMEARGINDALAYDRDFEQAGFVPLLRADSA